MKGLYGQFLTDNQIERDGVWLNFGPVDETDPESPIQRIKVARAGGANAAFGKRYNELLAPHRLQVQHGLLPEEVAAQIIRQVYAETVVRGWENIGGPDGAQLEFNPKTAEQLFKDLPQLFGIVRKAADDFTLFRQQVRDEDAKN